MLAALAKWPAWALGLTSGLIFLGVYALLNYAFLGGELLNGANIAGAAIFGFFAYRTVARRRSTVNPSAADGCAHML